MPQERRQPGREARRAEETYQAGEQNVDQYDRDLDPDGMAGRNVAGEGPDPVRSSDGVRTAYDVKEVHRRLHDLTDDELKTIPIVAEGTRLQQGATYVDLLGDRREMTATGEMSATKGTAFAPKDSVDYQLWNRLIGVTNPERLGQADDEAATP
jgi:hypothetical protein